MRSCWCKKPSCTICCAWNLREASRDWQNRDTVCIYRGDNRIRLDVVADRTVPVFPCALYKECTEGEQIGQLRVCGSCRSYVADNRQPIKSPEDAANQARKCDCRIAACCGKWLCRLYHASDVARKSLEQGITEKTETKLRSLACIHAGNPTDNYVRNKKCTKCVPVAMLACTIFGKCAVDSGTVYVDDKRITVQSCNGCREFAKLPDEVE